MEIKLKNYVKSREYLPNWHSHPLGDELGGDLLFLGLRCGGLNENEAGRLSPTSMVAFDSSFRASTEVDLVPNIGLDVLLCGHIER